MIWALQKSNGEWIRAADGQPMYYRTKREAEQAAKAANLQNYHIIPVRD